MCYKEIGVWWAQLYKILTKLGYSHTNDIIVEAVPLPCDTQHFCVPRDVLRSCNRILYVEFSSYMVDIVI